MGGGGGATPKFLGGGSATPVLHLQNALKSRKSAATRVARQGVPVIVCNYAAISNRTILLRFEIAALSILQFGHPSSKTC